MMPRLFFILLAAGVCASASAAQPSIQPITSKPAIVNGLSLTVSIPTQTIAPSQTPITFTVELKNVSNQPITLWDADNFWSWKIQFAVADKQDGWEGPWLLKPLFEDDRDFADKTLKPGETLTVPVELKHRDDQDFEFDWQGNQDRPVAPVKDLPPGKYNLTISAQFPAPASTPPAQYWTGKIDSNSLMIEIVPPVQK